MHAIMATGNSSSPVPDIAHILRTKGSFHCSKNKSNVSVIYQCPFIQRVWKIYKSKDSNKIAYKNGSRVIFS